METFSDKLQKFLTNYKEFLSLYKDGFTYDGESLTAITVDWKELLRGDAPTKTKVDSLFVGITNAVCKLTSCESGQALDVIDGEDEFQVTLNHVIEILKDKNRGYGNAALAPNRFYSDSLTTSDCILIRLSDKIARAESLEDKLARNDDESDAIQEMIYDTTLDFVGYCILLYISWRVNDEPFLEYEGDEDDIEYTDEEKTERQLPVLVFPYRPTFSDISDTIKSGDFGIGVATAEQANGSED